MSGAALSLAPGPSTPGAPSGPTAESLGVRLVRAIAGQDREALAALLAPDVRFRALTPGATWEAEDPAGVCDIVLGTWFAPDRVVTGVRSVQLDQSLPVTQVGYRLAVLRPEGPTEIEQRAMYVADAEHMTALWLCCTGFHPA